jgi:hypothetical protein
MTTLTLTPAELTPIEEGFVVKPSRVIRLKLTSDTHKEAVRLVAEVLQARSEANAALSLGLATGGTKAAFGAEIGRKIKATQPALKAARREAAEASRKASVDRITARFEHFFENYSYLTKGQIAVIHAHEGWAGRQ